MTATLRAQSRDGHGKGAARKLRAQGMVPVVVYGHGDQTRSLAVSALDLEKLLHGISVENTMVSLTVEGGGSTDVLIRDVQTHPVKAHVIHVDFIQVHANEPIKLHVPIRLIGTAVGVRDGGGTMDQELHELEVECLPADIPEIADVDVSALGVGESVRVHDITLDRVTILTDREQTIATVHMPRVHDLDPGTDTTGGEPSVVGSDSASDDS